MHKTLVRKLTVAGLVGAVAMSAAARELTPEEALLRAGLFRSENTGIFKSRSANNTRLAHTVTLPELNSAAFYVFNYGNGNGYVVVSGDDRLREILGYAAEGDFDSADIPSNVAWWLDNYRREIKEFISKSDTESSSLKPLTSAQAETRTTIEPLVKTKWNQSAPYNNMCPSDAGGRSITGCVATAMAQIVNYHRWPDGNGSGSNSYTSRTGLTSSFDYSATRFDWDNMLDIYDGNATQAQQDAVARLMFGCGVGIHMNYSSQESGAFSFAVPWALTKFFNFDSSAFYEERDGYLNEDWEDLVYGELAAGRPVLYSGQATNGGHAFVCDGYENGLFHINWGWGGAYDGHFALSALNPDGQGIGGYAGGYNTDQSIVYSIKPGENAGTCDGFLKGIGSFTYVPDQNGDMLSIFKVGNFHPENGEYTLGLDYIPVDGGATKEIELGNVNLNTVNITTGTYYYNNWNIQAPQSVGLSAGTYKVYPAYVGASGVRHRLRFPVVNQSYILLTVGDDGTYTYSNPGAEVKADISVIAFTPQEDIYKGSDVTFYIAVRNNNKGYSFSGKIDVTFKEKNSGRTVLTDNLTLSIAENGTESGTINYQLSLDPGEYTVTFTDENGKNIGAKDFDFKVLEGEAPALTGNLQIHGLTQSSFYKGYTHTLSFTILNQTSNAIETRLDICIMSEDGSIPHALGVQLNIPAGQNTFNLSGFHTGDLPAGEYSLRFRTYTDQDGFAFVSNPKAISVFGEYDGAWYGVRGTGAYLAPSPFGGYQGDFVIPATATLDANEFPVTEISESAIVHLIGASSLFILPESVPSGTAALGHMLRTETDIYVTADAYDSYRQALGSAKNNLYSKIDELRYDFGFATRSATVLEVGDEMSFKLCPIPASPHVNPNFMAESKLADVTFGAVGEDGTVPVSVKANNVGDDMLILSSAQPILSSKVSLPITVAEKGTTGISDVEACHLTIATEGNDIIVTGIADGETVSVYALNGMLVMSARGNGEPIRMTIGKGAYIVRASGSASKVII